MAGFESGDGSDFLRGSSQSSILKKLLAAKISPERCAYSESLELDKAA